MTKEICGDGHLSLAKRLQYIYQNLLRNIAAGGGKHIAIEQFFGCAIAPMPGTGSPGRILTDNFLRNMLPQLLPIGPIRILELGCGSGRQCRVLSELGYTGSYTGLDIFDRFDRNEVAGFEKKFVLGDAHDFEPGEQRYDLIVSVSALEHIPDDERLIRRLPGWLAPDGLDLHFIPGGWALPTYLWHGWRQYPLGSIERRFGIEAVATTMGGLPSMLLHLGFITLGEILLRLRIRKRAGRMYQLLLSHCLRWDRFLPSCSLITVVRRRAVR